MNKKEILVYSIVLILVFILIFGVVYVFVKGDDKRNEQTNENPISTTTEELGGVAEVEKNATSSEELELRKWEIYKNDDLGVSFKYPEGYSVEIEKEGFLDVGNKININVITELNNGLMTFSATSPDYKQGIQEGCCYDYSAPSIDTNLSINEIVQKLSNFNPVGVELGYISGVKSVKFISIKEYVNYSAQNALLIPIQKESFSNILVLGPVLLRSEMIDFENKEEIKEDFISKINSGEYRSDEKVESSLSIYSSIIDSVELE